MGELADQELIGKGVDIHPTAQFINVKKLEIGDFTVIGPGVRVIGGEFRIGEYSKVHNNSYIYSKNSIHLGHCTWIGQGTHLDGTGGIKAGDFLGVGINSALYSHIRHGDITEGCRFDQDGYLEIGHDVWLVGMCLVSPVKMHDKSMALLGSVITREMDFNSIYGGNPAIDLTPKLGRPWKEVSLDQRTAAVLDYVDHFFENERPDLDRDAVLVTDRGDIKSDGQTVYDVSTRTYRKTNSISEIALNKWMFAYRAKFRPTPA